VVVSVVNAVLVTGRTRVVFWVCSLVENIDWLTVLNAVAVAVAVMVVDVVVVFVTPLAVLVEVEIFVDVLRASAKSTKGSWFHTVGKEPQSC
jgi:hypothetical protein